VAVVTVRLRDDAASVCSGVSGFVYRDGSPHSGVIVKDSTGTTLIRRTSIGDSC
jgi:hypothetical protein